MTEMSPAVIGAALFSASQPVVSLVSASTLALKL